jgi:hypothetical protein
MANGGLPGGRDVSDLSQAEQRGGVIRVAKDIAPLFDKSGCEPAGRARTCVDRVKPQDEVSYAGYSKGKLIRLRVKTPALYCGPPWGKAIRSETRTFAGKWF